MQICHLEPILLSAKEGERWLGRNKVDAARCFPLCFPGRTSDLREVVDLFLPVRFYRVRRARWLKLQEEKAAREANGEAIVLAVASAPH